MGTGSINLGKRRILSKNPWDDCSAWPSLETPLKSLAETFLVPLQAKFDSSYPWELTAQTWQSGGFREELLKNVYSCSFFILFRCGGGVPGNINENIPGPSSWELLPCPRKAEEREKEDRLCRMSRWRAGLRVCSSVASEVTMRGGEAFFWTRSDFWFFFFLFFCYFFGPLPWHMEVPRLGG